MSALNPELESRLKDAALDRGRRMNDLVWRPSVYEGIFAHLPTAEGELWATNAAATAIRSIPGLAGLFDMTVPDEYIAVGLNDHGFSEACVACPCGEEHHVEVGTTVVAACGRAFYWFGHEVRRASLEPCAVCICPSDERGYEFADPKCPVCYPQGRDRRTEVVN